jgi:hypothetical protein
VSSSFNASQSAGEQKWNLKKKKFLRQKYAHTPTAILSSPSLAQRRPHIHRSTIVRSQLLRLLRALMPTLS